MVGHPNLKSQTISYLGGEKENVHFKLPKKSDSCHLLLGGLLTFIDCGSIKEIPLTNLWSSRKTVSQTFGLCINTQIFLGWDTKLIFRGCPEDAYPSYTSSYLIFFTFHFVKQWLGVTTPSVNAVLVKWRGQLWISALDSSSRFRPCSGSQVAKNKKEIDKENKRQFGSLTMPVIMATQACLVIGLCQRVGSTDSASISRSTTFAKHLYL